MACSVASGVTQQQLTQLRAEFPPKRTEVVTVYLRSIEKIEVSVPHVDVWSKYRGWVFSASPAGLPKTIAQMERALVEDIRIWESNAQTMSGQSAKAQAQRTAAWLAGPLRQYIERLKAATR
ncbi:MAG: hypothetical protein HZA32_00930 [Opitutae bacterium]|nr:hypothetical protein [Opitutae bacterium]